jgi:hypothetical protein
MGHDNERARFLETAGPGGIVLALSSAGGATGERSLPLMRSDRDWEILEARTQELIGSLASYEQQLILLRGLLAPLLRANASFPDDARKRIRSIAAHALETLRVTWDERAKPLGVRNLATFYELSVSARIDIASPKLESSWSDAVEDLREAVTKGWFPEDLQAMVEFGEMVRILARNEPRFLRVVGWPEAMEQELGIVSGLIAERVMNLDTLDPNEEDYLDIGEDDYVLVPVEPSDDEEDERTWLEDLSPLLDGIPGWRPLDDKRYKGLLALCAKHLETRQSRHQRWGDRDDRGGDPGRDYGAPRTQGSGDFDIDEFFADL